MSTSRPASRRADRYFVRPMPFVVMAIVSRPAVFSVFNRPAVCTGTRTMVDRLVFNSTFSTNRLYHAIGVLNILCRAGEQDKYTMNKVLRETQTLRKCWL